MRVEKTVRNSITAIISYLIIGVTTLVVRKLFVLYLPLEFLGYEGLFSNIFSLLALADMGIETVILYRLIEAFAKQDNEEMAAIIQIYKWLYAIVGGIIMIVGVMLIPLLEGLVSKENIEAKYIYIVYFLQLVSTLCTYFLAYKRLIFMVSQKEYVCVKIDSACTIISQFVKISVIIIWRSYIAYLVVGVLNNFISNIIISKKANKEFVFLKNNEKTVSLKGFFNNGYGTDIKNNLIQKVAMTVYGGTDNILITLMLGVRYTALVSNYLLTSAFVTTLLSKLLHPLQAPIGNVIYAEKREKSKNLFYMFDMVSFLIGTTVAVCYAVLFEDFIVLWLGEAQLLPDLYVVFFAINQYVLWNHQILTYYRYSFGKYETDRNYVLIGAVLNIILSILFAHKMGVAGIMLGTVIGHAGIWIGRARAVQLEYFKEDGNDYWIKQIIRAIIFGVELYFVILLSEYIFTGNLICDLAIKLVCCFLIPNITNTVLFAKTAEMKEILKYIREIVLLLVDKIRKKNI